MTPVHTEQLSKLRRTYHSVSEITLELMNIGHIATLLVSFGVLRHVPKERRTCILVTFVQRGRDGGERLTYSSTGTTAVVYATNAEGVGSWPLHRGYIQGKPGIENRRTWTVHCEKCAQERAVSAQVKLMQLNDHRLRSPSPGYNEQL